MKLSFITILAVLFTFVVCGATKKAEVVRFRPITRAEYNEILKLTNGKTTISEARLISSGLAVLKNIATYTTRFLPNLWSVFGVTQTTTADIDVVGTEGSYPLCVVSNDKQSDSVEYEDTINNLPSMDCIIVVRKSQHEEESQYQEQYYEDPEPISMLPDYQHYPYATIPAQQPYALPPPPPPPPYQTYPYAIYPPYPYYSPYAGYPHQQFLPQYPQPALQQYPQSAIPLPMELEAQNQNQLQTQADYYQQPNYAHFGAPFYPPPLPSAQHNFNANSGPIVHVIRGDKRGHQDRALSKAKRPRRRVFRNSLENGYAQTKVARPQYTGQSYPKVSLSRSATYDGPVYVMIAEKQLY